MLKPFGARGRFSLLESFLKPSALRPDPSRGSALALLSRLGDPELAPFLLF